MIGNSHGKELLNGLVNHFNDVFKELTIMVRDYCMPFLYQYAIIGPPDRDVDWTTVCQRYETDVIDILEQWNEPVDIIFVVIEYFKHHDPPLSDKDDEYLVAMQRFYDRLNNIAREVVFLPGMHLDWGADPFAQIYQEDLYFQRDYKTFQKPVEVNVVRL